MKTITPRIERAIDIFLDAISNNTLAKGTCAACAVGNLVSEGMGGKLINFNTTSIQCNRKNTLWSNAFCTSQSGVQHKYRDDFDNPGVLENVSATEFSLEELMAIEFAFETNTKIHIQRYGTTSPKDIRQDQINGLKAVVEVMMDFDNVKQDVKKIFTDKAELIPIQ
jgi:hypothetical protein